MADYIGTSGDDSYWGGSDADHIEGLGGRDYLLGNGGDDEIFGGDGDDNLHGGDGNDLLEGGEGNDLLTGEGGLDTLRGQGGDDRLLLNIYNSNTVAGSSVDGGTGVDTLQFDGYSLSTATNFSIADPSVAQNLFGATVVNVERLVFRSGAGNDDITGGALNDFIDGFDGDDRIDGGLGDDTLDGGVGTDTVYGGGGNDIFRGGSDLLYGGEGDDTLRWAGDVLVDGGAGTDELRIEYYSSIGMTADLSDPSVETMVLGTRVIGVERLWLLAGSGNDHVTGGVGNDLLAGGAGDDILAGGTGDDNLSGGDGADQLSGGAGDDALHNVTSEASSPADLIDGGDGFDTLEFRVTSVTGPVTIDLLATSGMVTNVEQITFSGGSGVNTVSGGSATDIITGGASGDIFDGRGGDDEIHGEGGDDVLTGGDGADWLDGGGDSDTAAYATAAGPVTVSLALLGTAQQTGGAGLDFLSSIENLTGSAFADTLKDNGGNNRLDGGGGNDFLWLTGGGSDAASGGSGNDVFLFGSKLNGFDSIDGGAGADQIAIQGGEVFTFGSGVVSIESLAILSGTDKRFGDTLNNLYDYDITTRDVNVAAGVELVVDANKLLPGEDLTFNGSAETDGSFFIYGGRGTDTLTGGAKNDVFLFGVDGQWGSADRIVGGAGIDQLALRGNYVVTFGASQLVSIESIGLLSAHDTRFGPLGSSYTYDLTMNDANVAAGVQMTVDGAKLRIAENFTFNGAAETDGSFRVFGGLVDDTITGSQGADILQGNAGADTLVGSGGADTFRYAATSDSTASALDHILDFDSGSDKIDLTRIDANSFAAGDQAFHWIGAAGFTGAGESSAGELRAYDNNGTWFVEGDVNGDGVADIVISVTTSPPDPLVQGDFLL